MTYNVFEIKFQTPDRVAELTAINNHNHDDHCNIDRVNWRGKTYNAPKKKSLPELLVIVSAITSSSWLQVVYFIGLWMYIKGLTIIIIIIVIVEPTGWKTRDDQMKLYRFYVRAKTTRTGFVNKTKWWWSNFYRNVRIRSHATTRRHRLIVIRTIIEGMI